MTIIVGIICKDAIVLACDSRTTDTSGNVRDDAQKLQIISFDDGNSVLIGQAGNDDLSSRLLEILKPKAAQSPMRDYRTIADLVQESSEELKAQLAALRSRLAALGARGTEGQRSQ